MTQLGRLILPVKKSRLRVSMSRPETLRAWAKCCAKMAAGSPDMEPEVSIRMNIGNRAVVMVR